MTIGTNTPKLGKVIACNYCPQQRSLGQGNMFTGVCLSTGGCLLRGVPAHGVPAPWGVPAPGGVGSCSGGGCLVETPQTATAAGGTYPTGMHSCIENII